MIHVIRDFLCSLGTIEFASQYTVAEARDVRMNQHAALMEQMAHEASCQICYEVCACKDCSRT